MQILLCPTEEGVLGELTYLASDADAGSSSLTVENGNGYDTNDYIVIERKGTETAELKLISTVSKNTITLTSATSFDHKDGIQIQKIAFNERKFYRSTTETGTFTLLDTKPIEVDRPEGTFYEDDDGLSSHWYKATYYNSTTLKETHLDDAIATKAAESDHYTSIIAVRKQAGFEEAFGISDSMIEDYRAEAENEFESKIAIVYTTPLASKPKIGRQIVNLLAAGNLLVKEYGTEADIEISKSGARMLERAKELIEQIIEGTLQLIDDDGNVIGAKTTFDVSGSNEFDTADDRGELFNIDGELFNFKDPDQPRS